MAIKNLKHSIKILIVTAPAAATAAAAAAPAAADGYKWWQLFTNF